LPPAVASSIFWSTWLIVSMWTKTRFWEALKASTTARIASASNPVHFSQ
jgi:hypothetical protein